MAGPNFTLITELQTLHRRDFPLVASNLLNPFDANPLVDGEWLEVSSATVYQLARGVPGGTNNEGINPAVFPVHTERGRYDTQAIAKATVLMLGMYEAESTVINNTSMTIGKALTVADVTFGGLTRRGLRAEGAVASRVVVGFVTKTFTAAGGVAGVRFVHFCNQQR